jgi:NAD(P)-dependent dehydrogenase (short-subunit alcohol dehydrogenase family)
LREETKTKRMNMTANGQTILITGSTDGVGRVVALKLGAEGAHILVHGRDSGRGEAVAEEVRRRGGTATFYAADFSSLAAVRGLAEVIGREHERLDVLVNNAGIGFGRGRREESADGFELRFAVNYLAGFLLTRLLLPRLGGEKPSRIVNVSSLGQQTIDFSDVMLERGYEGMRAYRQSKLAQVMFTIDLAAELAGAKVTVNSLHPATFMDTTMVRETGMTPLSTVDEGADAILQLIESPALEGRSGLFFNGRREARADRQAYDSDARKRLSELSFRLTGLIDAGGALRHREERSDEATQGPGDEA